MRADPATIARLRRQVQKSPGDAEALHTLAVLLFESGQTEQAVYFEQRAASVRPAVGDFHATLSTMLAVLGRRDDAIDAARRAIEVEPDRAARHLALVPLAWDQGDHETALASAERAYSLDPASARASLASVLLNVCRAERAIAILREGLEAMPEDPWLLSSLASTLNYADVTREEVLEAHRRAGAALASRAIPLPAPVRTPLAGRRVRVGYLSGDLYDHSVAAFLEPILAHHDRDAFEVHALSARSSQTADAVTGRLRSLCHAWHDLGRDDPEAIARRVHALGLDVVVDLAGYTGCTLLLAMASRLAPTQVTYLGYPNTTGIPAMDVRLVDETTDPPGAEDLATERLVRLPAPFLCYRPPTDAPVPAPRPSAGPIRFGSFNNAAKLTPATLAAWARVLRTVPGSVLALKSRQFTSAMVRRTIVDRLSAAGVDPARVEVLEPPVSKAEHLAAYAGVDIALDSFPYHGTTTTCEALWMGVPVVTLAGDRHAARVGASLLRAVGLGELVADSWARYEAVAVELTNAPDRLSRWRAELRAQVARSPLCDATRFVAGFEAGLREAMERRR
ncbi:MAG: tetratricopeptide repeat protein [Phycisphaerae bacterium]|nr:tetratricopeptide repeat protein [Phycisphaerae bacterium]